MTDQTKKLTPDQLAAQMLQLRARELQKENRERPSISGTRRAPKKGNTPAGVEHENTKEED